MKVDIGSVSEEIEIFNLLVACAQDMKEKKIFQWNENYPTIQHVKNDILNGSLFCLKENNKIIGIIVIDEDQSPDYKDINWKFDAHKVLVVHRLAVLPTHQKKGIGKKLMDFALKFAQENNYSSIRLDAFSGNERILKFYLNRDYHKRGEIYFPYRDLPFYCFEKQL